MTVTGETRREISYLSCGLSWKIAIGSFLEGPNPARLQIANHLIEVSATHTIRLYPEDWYIIIFLKVITKNYTYISQDWLLVTRYKEGEVK